MSEPEPPPADTSWIQMETIGGHRVRSGYVHRPSREERHTCPLPAEWEVGAVWRCPEGHLWAVRIPPNPYRDGYAAMGREWAPAGWWMRCRYGGKRARGDMANGNRRPGPPKPPTVKGAVYGHGPAPTVPPPAQDKPATRSPRWSEPRRGVESVPGIPPPVPWTPQDPDAPPKDFDG